MNAQNHHKHPSGVKIYQGRSHTKKQKKTSESKTPIKVKKDANKSSGKVKPGCSKKMFRYYQPCKKPIQPCENNSSPNLNNPSSMVKKTVNVAESKASPLGEVGGGHMQRSSLRLKIVTISNPSILYFSGL